MTFLKRLFLILINQHEKSLGSADSLNQLTDEQLVAKIVANNDSMLFGVLYDRYSRMVYNKCFGFARSQDEAEDLTQDVFLMLFVKLASFKGKSKFSTWLYSFTYNFCVNYVNRNKQRRMSDKSVSMDTAEYRLTEDVPDEQIFEMKATKLARALKIMDVDEKSLLLLKYQDGASIRELCELYEVGESAMKMRLKRAKAKLVEIYNANK